MKKIKLWGSQSWLQPAFSRLWLGMKMRPWHEEPPKKAAAGRIACPTIVPTMALALLLGGCMVGPKYKTPTAMVPPAYKEAPPASFKEGDGWKTAQPGDQTIRGNWWEIFGDAQLNTLEEQLTTGNQDLKAAEARFRQARDMIRFNRAAQFPTISTAPSISSERVSSNRPFFTTSPAPSGDFLLPFDLSYEVDLWGRVRRTVSAAREQAQATAADLETASLSLHAELAYDYFELRAADSQKRLLDDT